jgi:plasmid stability protein
MRTTLTLDEDVAAKLREQSRRSGRPFKAVVNEVLRLGLNTQQTPKNLEPFQIQARDLGLRPGVQLDNIGEVLEQLDGPAHK